MAVLARYLRLLCARARALLLPVRYSCPLAFPTCFLLPLIWLPVPRCASTRFAGRREHPQARALPLPVAVTRGYPFLARVRISLCARTRTCPWLGGGM